MLSFHFAHRLFRRKLLRYLTCCYRGLKEAPNVKTKWIIHRGIAYFGYETIREIEKDEELVVDYGKEWAEAHAKGVGCRGP